MNNFWILVVVIQSSEKIGFFRINQLIKYSFIFIQIKIEFIENVNEIREKMRSFLHNQIAFNDFFEFDYCDIAIFMIFFEAWHMFHTKPGFKDWKYETKTYNCLPNVQLLFKFGNIHLHSRKKTY